MLAYHLYALSKPSQPLFLDVRRYTLVGCRLSAWLLLQKACQRQRLSVNSGAKLLLSSEMAKISVKKYHLSQCG